MVTVMLYRLRRRRWMWWHMRHPYTNYTGTRWICSCGSTFENRGR